MKKKGLYFIIHNARGQMSIFFATMMIIIVGLMAFTINIGLYVKAKINLQNAVDAAAWAGAATQARHLTNIGYLNWEMRNIYKEWMFKYYVLGNLSIKGVKEAMQGTAGASTMKFNMTNSVSSDPANQDKFNVPSVCIHYQGATNICAAYQIPGLPRLDSVQVAGSQSISSDFINTLVTQKAEACSNTSKLNFMVAMAWAYGGGSQSAESRNFYQGAPQIALNRQGAWPQAIEMAMRVRNLEYALNSPPISGGVCAIPGACAISLNELSTTKHGLMSERTMKAYMSAYRNLGNDIDDEVKQTFVMTELPPTAIVNDNIKDLSNLLIPTGKTQKYYVNLKLHLLNLVTFYTAFVNQAGGSAFAGPNIQDQASCGATKIGLPVPGYPFGFVKDPNVITYYAVKGEAKFIGLFNPFTTGDGRYTRLRAFAAAKPMGGRVGPHLFYSDTAYLKGRTESGHFRSSGYLTGLRPKGTFTVGYPVPASSGFWLSSSADAVGGWQDDVKFSIPNVVYKDGGPFPNSAGESIQITGENIDPKMGLFAINQYSAFAKNLGVLPDTPVTNDMIEKAIFKARQPTKYDVKNYLVPAPHSINSGIKVDSFGESVNLGPLGEVVITVFAPLLNSKFLYDSPDALAQTIKDFINSQAAAIAVYRSQMMEVRSNILSKYSAADQLLAESSANIFADEDTTRSKPLTCASMLGKFMYFFSKETNLPDNGIQQTSSCPPYLVRTLNQLISSNQGQQHAFIRYFPDGSLAPEDYFTAYRPGVYSGSSPRGETAHPFTGSIENNKRNFYSSKLIAVKSVLGTSYNSQGYGNTSFPVYTEGSKFADGNEIKQSKFANPIDLGKLGLDVKEIPF